MVTRIPLEGMRARGRHALVDDEDAARIGAHRWLLWEDDRPGKPHRGPYALRYERIGGKWTRISMHGEVTGLRFVDHVNGDGLNNQKGNLRGSDHARNAHNQRAAVGGSSRYKGVSWDKQAGKWRVSMRIGGKLRNLGGYDDEVEAAKAYDRRALEERGEHARLNFPVVSP